MTVANDNELSAGDILTYAAHVVGCCVLWSLNLDFLYGSSLLIHAIGDFQLCSAFEWKRQFRG